MNSIEKSKFVAESLAGVINKHSREFREKNEKLIQNILNEGNYQEYLKVMSGVVMESAEVMRQWEKTSFDELDGLTPEQYYGSIKTSSDAVELVGSFIEKNEGMLPPMLMETIKGLEESIGDEILVKIESMIPDKDGKLSGMQKAVLKIAEIMASEKFAEPLSRLLFRLNKDVDEKTIECVMDALKEIGKPCIPCLIAMCEKSGHKGDIYIHSIMTLGEIGSKNKTEELYRYLKECFRKSEEKKAEANALAFYGDGRAVAAIRTYVERNIGNLHEQVYSTYRDIILRLGGLVSDLDREYSFAHRLEAGER